VAYNDKTNEFFVIESKNLTPARDAKAMAQVVSDHFKQKKYHGKFLKKIEWIKNNLKEIIQFFNTKFNIDISQHPGIKNFFVSARNSVVKYMVTEYSVISFSEFDKFLKDNYGS